jgi:hypothetical protein
LNPVRAGPSTGLANELSLLPSAIVEKTVIFEKSNQIAKAAIGPPHGCSSSVCE